MTPSGVLMPCTMLSAWAGALFLVAHAFTTSLPGARTSAYAPASDSSHLNRRGPVRGWLLRPSSIA